MFLRRLGNKKKLANEICRHFPPHNIYLEPFFGAGGMLFHKRPIAKYNYLNDIDSNIYNCFDVFMRRRQELTDYIENIPYHIDFWNEYKTRDPENEIEKAVYFIVLSNFGYMGKPNNLRFDSRNSKQELLKNIDKTYKFLVSGQFQFNNCDFRKFLNNFSFSEIANRNNAFIYCDPPYLNTTNNYSDSFKEADVIDLFDILQEKNIRFAYSEFKNEFVLNEAKKRGLNVIEICERQSMKNRNIEILITNYNQKLTLF